MPAVYLDDELDVLEVFRAFGIRSGEHLEIMTLDRAVQERFKGYDSWSIAERLAAKAAIRPDDDGSGYFLSTTGAELLYGPNDPPPKEPNMIPLSTDRNRLAKRSENRYRFLRSLYDTTGGARNAFTNMWELGTELGLSRDEARDAVDFLMGEGLLSSMTLGGGIGITHAGLREVEASISDPETPTDHFSVQVINNFHGPVVNQHGTGHTANVGNTSEATISNSSVGGVAVGPQAAASGPTNSAETTISKADFDALVAAAQKALVDDHDRLAEIADGLSDGLWQVLRRLRHLEFAVASVGEVQAQIKNTMDDSAVAALAAQLKGKTGTGALEVIKVLLRSSVTAEVAKRLLGS